MYPNTHINSYFLLEMHLFYSLITEDASAQSDLTVSHSPQELQKAVHWSSLEGAYVSVHVTPVNSFLKLHLIKGGADRHHALQFPFFPLNLGH